MRFAIVGLATIPFALATPTTNQWFLMGALVVRGFGLGAVTIPIMTVAYVGLDRADVPHASILTRIAQQVGGSFGVALLAVILQSAVARLGGNGTATAHAFDQTFWWAIGFTIVAIVVSLALLPARRATTISTPKAAPVVAA